MNKKSKNINNSIIKIEKDPICNLEFEVVEKEPDLDKLREIYAQIRADIFAGEYVDVDLIAKENKLWPSEVNALNMAITDDLREKNEQNKKNLVNKESSKDQNH